MLSIEDLKRRIRTATDLHSLVRTMKALAAVNIRQLERAAESLIDFQRTIEMGLQIVLRNPSRIRISAKRSASPRTGLIVFGSDQGMCGSLNDQIASYAKSRFGAGSNFLETDDSIADTRPAEIDQIVAVGSRVAARLENAKFRISKTVATASSIVGVTPLVHDLILCIDQWQRNRDIGRVTVIFAEHTSKASYVIKHYDLLPLDRGWLEAHSHRKWPTVQCPTFSMDPDRLFSSLIKQYLFSSLFRACVETQTSENASRLTAMRGAERTIGDRIETLQREFHQTRQMTITEELLDITSGFEAICSGDRP